VGERLDFVALNEHRHDDAVQFGFFFASFATSFASFAVKSF
jgi:hypothetical protein